MTLPAAAPACDGAILSIRLERCWVNRQYRSHRGSGQCTEPVRPTDDLGLCEEHRAELGL